MKGSDLELEAEILAENRSEEFIAGSMRTIETILELCINSEDQCLRREHLELLTDYMYKFNEYL